MPPSLFSPRGSQPIDRKGLVQFPLDLLGEEVPVASSHFFRLVSHVAVDHRLRKLATHGEDAGERMSQAMVAGNHFPFATPQRAFERAVGDLVSKRAASIGDKGVLATRMIGQPAVQNSL